MTSKKEKAEATEIFRNRIVGHGEIDPLEIIENPFNWRLHTERQEDALSGALEEIGWIQQVVINKKTGHLIDGHLRVKLAIDNGLSTVPVTYVELTEDEEKIAIATFDTIGAMALTDDEKFAEILAEAARLTKSKKIEEMLENVELIYPTSAYQYSRMPDVDIHGPKETEESRRVIITFASEEEEKEFRKIFEAEDYGIYIPWNEIREMEWLPKKLK